MEYTLEAAQPISRPRNWAAVDYYLLRRRKGMTRSGEPLEVCPRCKSNDHTKAKLVLIDRGDPAGVRADWRVSCPCEGDLSVIDLKSEFVVLGATVQFIQGLYCERCGIGYIPEHMAKRPA